MNNRYLIGSGYYAPIPDGEWLRIWWENLRRHAPDAERIVIMCAGEQSANNWASTAPTDACAEVDLMWNSGNLGHVHQLIGKQEPAKANVYCGWSASIIALAWIAYNDEADFVYIEQDALCFGDVIGEMYRQLGDGSMIFGSYKEQGQHRMPCGQSLFLVKHAFIPKFTQLYLNLPDDRRIDYLPERKFAEIERHEGVKRYSFHADRSRPLPYDDQVWSAQKFTPDELAELKRRELI